MEAQSFAGKSSGITTQFILRAKDNPSGTAIGNIEISHSIVIAKKELFLSMIFQKNKARLNSTKEKFAGAKMRQQEL